MAKYAYNNAVHATTGLMLFKALMGYDFDFDVELSKEPKEVPQGIQRRVEELNAF